MDARPMTLVLVVSVDHTDRAGGLDSFGRPVSHVSHAGRGRPTLRRAAAAAAATSLCWLALSGGAPAHAQPAQPTLNAPEARLSDAAIAADQRVFEAQQARLKALNDGGRPLRDYALAKAQCWLDVSYHEYQRNDRSAFVQQALAQAAQLADAMEQRREPGWATPLVNQAERLRPDLWARAEALRGHPGWACAQAKAACAEVELVHAGNEHRQLQWRHAQPYVQISEDLLGEAEQLAERCLPPPPPPPPVEPPVEPPVSRAAPVPVPVPVQQLMLSASVLFDFDRHEPAHMRPASVEQLQALARQVREQGLTVTRIQLTGYADRLNRTGADDYNQRLSERRTATVLQALQQLGLTAADVQTASRGDAQQVQACAGRQRSTAELHECLLPNRRVEVLLHAQREAPAAGR